MTRQSVYSTALVAFVIATVLTLTAIFVPEWVTWDVETKSGGHYRKTIGLHRSCSSIDGHCIHYPQYDDCHGTDRYFCSMWRSVGFLMSFAAVFELVIIVTYGVLIMGGKQKRETGWKVLVFMLMLVGIVQCAAMSIVAYLYDNDEERFFTGWELDKSWIMCTVSWSIAVLSALFLWLSSVLLPSEGGYELIPSEQRYDRD